MAHNARIEMFLTEQAERHPDLRDRYLMFDDLCRRRLWHQLTQELLRFIQDPGCARGHNLLQLHEEFVRHFSTRVNPLHYAQLVVAASRQHWADGESGFHSAFDMLVAISGARVDDVLNPPPPAAALPTSKPAAGAEESKRGDAAAATAAAAAAAAAAVSPDPEARAREDAAARRRQLGPEGFLVCFMELAMIMLRQRRFDDCKKMVEAGREQLGATDGADPVVHAAYYRVAAELHKLRGPATAYYSNALQYLAHTPTETMSKEEQVELATDISLAALVGEGVYNFGEVLATPILTALQGTPLEWLSDLMHVFNAGDIERFNVIMNERAEQVRAQPALMAHQEALKQKITLLHLMELVFRRPATNRVLRFSEIADATKLPVEQVEWLLMKAMATSLIRGEIDEVEQLVRVTFVQPRVLDKGQIATLRERLTQWTEKVHQTQLTVEGRTEELFA